MGYFAELVICDLQKDADGITPYIEMTRFNNKTFVSWQSNAMKSKKDWQDLAHQTIFFRKPGKILGRNSYEATYMVRKIKSGIIKKREGYEFSPHFENLPAASLIHIVLPELYIPSMRSFREFVPHVKKKGKRIALTWPFESRAKVRFYFHKASKEEFGNFKASGMDLEIKLDPEFRESLQHAGERISDEVRDLATTTAAKFLNEYASP